MTHSRVYIERITNEYPHTDCVSTVVRTGTGSPSTLRKFDRNTGTVHNLENKNIKFECYSSSKQKNNKKEQSQVFA